MFKKTTFIKNEASNEVLFFKKTIDETIKKSQILVGPTDVAFIEKDGMLLDVLEEGIHNIFDKKSTIFPFIKERNSKSGIDVIFMNKTLRSQILWGTPNYINAVDPNYTVPIEIGSSGELEVQINNPRKFYLELVGRDNEFTIKDLKKRLTQQLISQLEPNIITALHDLDVSSEHILLCKNQVEENMRNNLKQSFFKNYGINLVSLSISKMFITEQSVENISKAKDTEFLRSKGIYTQEQMKKQQEIDQEVLNETIEITEQNYLDNEEIEIQEKEVQNHLQDVDHEPEVEITIETQNPLENNEESNVENEEQDTKEKILIES